MAFVVAPPSLLPQVPISSFFFSSQDTFLHLSRSSSSSNDNDKNDGDTKKSNNPYADLKFVEVSRKFESKEFLDDAVNTFGASFCSCTVNVSTDGSSFVTGNGEGRFLSLSFLDELRHKDESFLPQTIYVRDCMNFIFDLSEKDDRRPMYGDHILIGSPGIGKSVLFFLMALSKARSTPLVYFRKKQGNDFCSVFFMNAKGNGKVHIVFSRSLLKRKTTTRTILEFLDDQKVDNSLYYTFLDGPRHDDKVDTLSYDYFCTSGGYPGPKDEARSNTFIWILDAWTKEEVIDALTHKSVQELSPSASQPGSSELYAPAVGTMDKNLAAELYSLCGGEIRRIIDATKDREDIESWFQEVANSLNKKTIDLALTSNMRGDSNLDSIRSMFRRRDDYTKYMLAIQIVDSRYALKLLMGSLTIGKFLEAFHLSKSLVQNALEDVYFELCCHCWFKSKTSASETSAREQGFPLREFVQGTGTGAASVHQLTNADCYWVPSVSNFADIGAAFLHQGTFYALQYTGAKQRPFDCERFGESVLAVVHQKGLSFRAVCVAFVVPECSKNFTRPFMPGDVSFFTESSGGTSKKKTCSLVAETWLVETTTEQRFSLSLSTSLSMSMGKLQSS